MTNKYIVTLTVNLDQALYNKIQSEAKRTYSTKTQVMRRLISELQPKAEV